MFPNWLTAAFVLLASHFFFEFRQLYRLIPTNSWKHFEQLDSRITDEIEDLAKITLALIELNDSPLPDKIVLKVSHEPFNVFTKPFLHGDTYETTAVHNDVPEHLREWCKGPVSWKTQTSSFDIVENDKNSSIVFDCNVAFELTFWTFFNRVLNFSPLYFCFFLTCYLVTKLLKTKDEPLNEFQQSLPNNPEWPADDVDENAVCGDCSLMEVVEEKANRRANRSVLLNFVLDVVERCNKFKNWFEDRYQLLCDSVWTKSKPENVIEDSDLGDEGLAIFKQNNEILRQNREILRQNEGILTRGSKIPRGKVVNMNRNAEVLNTNAAILARNSVLLKSEEELIDKVPQWNKVKEAADKTEINSEKAMETFFAKQAAEDDECSEAETGNYSLPSRYPATFPKANESKNEPVFNIQELVDERRQNRRPKRSYPDRETESLVSRLTSF